MNPKKIFIVFSSCLLLLIGFYIFQINSITAHAYSLTSAESQLSKLTKANRTLQADKATAYTVKRLSDLAKTLKFEKIDSISYIHVIGSTVAKRTSSNE